MGTMLWGAGAFLFTVVCYVIKVSIEIMRLRRRRKKMLWGAGTLVIVLAVLGMIYKILFRE